MLYKRYVYNYSCCAAACSCGDVTADLPRHAPSLPHHADRPTNIQASRATDAHRLEFSARSATICTHAVEGSTLRHRLARSIWCIARTVRGIDQIPLGSSRHAI